MAKQTFHGSCKCGTVKFEANLDSGDEHRFIDARENWTFERKVDDTDPNWRLAAVSSVS